MSFRQVTNPHMKKSVVTIAMALVLLVEVSPETTTEELLTLVMAILGPRYSLLLLDDAGEET